MMDIFLVPQEVTYTVLRARRVCRDTSQSMSKEREGQSAPYEGGGGGGILIPPT